MKDIVEVDDFSTPITVPEGTDSRDHAAEHVESIAQRLANRTKHLKDTLDPVFADAARKSASNTFTQPNTFAADVTSSGTVRANRLKVGGEGTGFIGWIHSAEDITADRDIGADRDVNAGRDYGYYPLPTRTVIVPIGQCYGDVFRDGANGAVGSATGGFVAWILRLPQGAVIQNVEVIGSQNGTSPAQLKLTKRSGYNWSTGSQPLEQNIDSKSTPAVAGFYKVTLSGASTSVDNAATEYQVHFTRGQISDMVQALRVTFVDPGPRNH